MKRLLTITISMCLMITLRAQVIIDTEDFKMLDNTNWEGTLTYLDYTSGKPTDVATTMQMRISENTIEQDIQYVWEPHKNVKSKTKIKKNGKFLGSQEVISKSFNKENKTVIITSTQGKDDGRKATLYFTYEFDEDSYKVSKEVQLDDSEDRFVRNSYQYTRIK
ncbi:MAG: hypothetical protein JXR10_10860 [Cyclobacteriaceae bacterium]